MLTSSSLRGRGRPLGLTLGILVSFGVITLTVSYLVHLIGFDASLLRTFAVVVLAAISATLLLPKLGAPVEARLSRLVGGAGWTRAGDGFWAGFVSGLPLGMHKPADGSGTVRVLVDGRPVDATNAGADVHNGIVTVDSDRLYELVNRGSGQDSHILRLELSPGIQLYAFTFG